MIEATKENSRILSEVIQARVNKKLKENYPTAEELIAEPIRRIIYK